MKRSLVAVAAATSLSVLLGAGLLWTWRKPPHAGGPPSADRPSSVRVLPEGLSLGRIKPGTTRTVEFAVSNESQHPVSIEGVRKSCSCVSVTWEFPKTAVPPGGRGIIRCSFTPEPGPQSFALLATFSDGSTGRATLSYEGVRPFALAGSGVMWDTIIAGSPSVDRTLTLYGDPACLNRPVTVQPAPGLPPWLGVSFQTAHIPPAGAEASGARSELGAVVFRVGPDAPVGNFSLPAALTVTVDEEQHPFLVQCVGEIRPAVYSTVERLVFIGAPWPPATFHIRSLEGPLVITALQATLGESTFVMLSNQEAQVRLALPHRTADTKGTLVVGLDHPQIKSIVIPITVSDN